MIRKTAIAAFIGIAALAAAAPAPAQAWSPDNGMGDNAFAQRPGPGFDDMRPRFGRDWGAQGEAALLPPRAIMGSLFRRGFRDIDIRRVRGLNYIATAQSPRGGRVLVVVDGRTTEIAGLRPIGFERPRPFAEGDDFPPRPWGGPRW